MASLGAAGDGRTCPACTAPVREVLTLGGRVQHLDPEPHPDGVLVPARRPDGAVRARVLTGDELPALEPAWRPHRCTPATARAPRCTVCRLPMDPALARRERWTAHPTCDPTDHAAAARGAARQHADQPPVETVHVTGGRL